MPKGYKASPLGLIPIDWEVKKISNIAKITSGTTPLRGESEYHTNGTINWVKTTDLNNSVIERTEEKITEKALKETSLKLYPKETILVAMYGGFNQIGRTGILGIEATINQALSAIIVNKNETSPQFLLYWLNGKIELWKNLAGSSRKDPNITGKDVGDFPFLKIPLAEQVQIANVLLIFDNALQTTQNLIAQKELRKKWLMQQLLTGKKRLKGFDGEWENVKLSEYTKKVKGKVFEVSIDKTGLPCITATSFNSKYIDFTNSTDAVSCCEKDVLILWDGENAGAVTTNHNGIIGSTVAKLVLKKGLDNFFITYLLHFENQRLRSIREGSGIPHMPGDFEEWFHFQLPSIGEQTSIGQVLKTADKEIQLLKAKADKLKEQKKGMMQVLLTGKKRLKVV